MQLSASWPEMKFEKVSAARTARLSSPAAKRRGKKASMQRRTKRPMRSFCARMYTAMMVEKTTSMTPLTTAVPTLAAVPKTSPAVPIRPSTLSESALPMSVKTLSQFMSPR